MLASSLELGLPLRETSLKFPPPGNAKVPVLAGDVQVLIVLFVSFPEEDSFHDIIWDVLRAIEEVVYEKSSSSMIEEQMNVENPDLDMEDLFSEEWVVAALLGSTPPLLVLRM